MPRGEIEFHPYLALGEIPNASKLILGSFPVYECTNDDSAYKQQIRIAEKTIRFFYGSHRSSFWRLYSQNIDPQIILPPNKEAIIRSLNLKKIAITDTIFSCQRIEKSSSDIDLRGRKWNKNQIRRLIKNGVIKILCTSKGVLQNLEHKILCPAFDRFASVDQQQSILFQEYFVSHCAGNNQIIKGPIARVFKIRDSGAVVKAVAIPSPGSPQRKLNEFGFEGSDWESYSSKYFQLTFNWINH